jgi:hypothetical protein
MDGQYYKIVGSKTSKKEAMKYEFGSYYWNIYLRMEADSYSERSVPVCRLHCVMQKQTVVSILACYV